MHSFVVVANRSLVLDIPALCSLTTSTNKILHPGGHSSLRTNLAYQQDIGPIHLSNATKRFDQSTLNEGN